MTPPVPAHPPRLAERFAALDALLLAHGEVWRPRPFVACPVPWEARWPEAAAWIDLQPPERLESEGWTAAPDVPACFQAWAHEVARWAEHPPAGPEHPDTAVGALPSWFGRGLPGRKRGQVEAFAAALGPWIPPDGPLRLLDWCGGKAWLGHALLHPRVGAPHTALRVVEWQAALGAEAEQRCARIGLPCDAHAVDALGAEAAALLDGVDVAVALHACGDLHAALITAAVDRRVPRLALAPCCYNRVAEVGAVVRSAPGRASALHPTLHDLDFLHREVVVAHAGDVRRSRQQQAWRLGFEAWRAATTGDPSYRPLPSFDGAWTRTGDFAAFCKHFMKHLQNESRIAARETGEATEPPGAPAFPSSVEASLDPAPFEAEGARRLTQVRRREAVRGLFRPALEAWLVLDRALALEARGYTVTVVRFCPRGLTPRNALIRAERRSGSTGDRPA